MTIIGWIATVVALVALVAAVAAQRTAMRLRSEVREVRRELQALRDDSLPLLADTRAALRRADGANRKAEHLLDAALSLTETKEQATRVAVRAVGHPVVRVAAFGTGVRRGLRRLAGRSARSDAGRVGP